MELFQRAYLALNQVLVGSILLEIHKMKLEQQMKEGTYDMIKYDGFFFSTLFLLASIFRRFKRNDSDNSQRKSLRFSKQLNFFVHLLNYSALINNYSILAENKGEFWLNYKYGILAIYSPAAVSISEIIFFMKQAHYKKCFTDSFRLPNLIWKFLEGFCRFSCFCACIGELLQESNWFFTLIAIQFFYCHQIDPKIKKYDFNQKYFLNSSFHNQICFNSKRKCYQKYIMNNGATSLFICLTFILRSLYHPTFRIYDILLYCSFTLTLPFIFSSFYYSFQLLKYGPYDYLLWFEYDKEYLNNNSQYQNIQRKQKYLIEKYRKIIQIMSQKYLVQELCIKFYKKKMNLQIDFFPEDFAEFLFDLVDIQIVRQNVLKQISFVLWINSQREDTIFIFQNNTAEFHEPLISFLLIFIYNHFSQNFDKYKELKFILNCQQSKIIAFEVQKEILQKGTSFHPNYFMVQPQIPFDSANLLSREMIQIIAFQKIISPHLNQNPSSCLYDLEDQEEKYFSSMINERLSNDSENSQASNDESLFF